MTDRNCRITSSKMGSIYLRAESLAYGVDIISSENSTANVRVMNTQMRVNAPFSVGVAFVSYAEATKFYNWIRRWGALASSTGTNPLRVEMPSRNFDRIGVYQSGVTHGDAVGLIVPRMTLRFLGARNPLDVKDLVNNSTDISYFIGAKDTKDALDAPFHFPWTAISSTSDFSADEGLYGVPKTPVAPPIPPVAPGEQRIGFDQ